MRRRAASVMVPITILKSAVSDGAGMYAAACVVPLILGLGGREIEVWIEIIFISLTFRLLECGSCHAGCDCDPHFSLNQGSR
jgi:hypothetical protein